MSLITIPQTRILLIWLRNQFAGGWFPRVPSNQILTLRRVAVLSLTVAVAHQTLIIWGPIERLQQFGTVDDTFLYLRVASNWARTGLPSFDGQITTNGFQPLWGAITALVATVTDGELLLRVVCQLGSLLNLATGLIVLGIGADLGERRIGSVAALFYAAFLLTPRTFSGMEGELHGLVFALLLRATIQHMSTDPAALLVGDTVKLSGYLTLNGLVRLDSGLISAGVALVILYRMYVRRRADLYLAFLALPTLALTLYLGISQLVFHTPFPVSGSTKWFYVHGVLPRSLPETILFAATGTVDRLLSTLGALIPSAVRYALPILGLGGFIWGRHLTRRARVFLLIFGFTLLHLFVFYAAMQEFAYANWYYRPLTLCLAVFLGYAVTLCPRGASGRLLLATGTIILLLALATRAYHSWHWESSPSSLYVNRYRAAQWLETTDDLAPPVVVGAWNSGQLGFFAPSRRVINLDGLVQSVDYVDTVLRPNAWKQYFRQQGIRYIMDYNVKFKYRDKKTQSIPRAWDESKSFRGVVDLTQVRVMHSFLDIQVLDLTEWLNQP